MKLFSYLEYDDRTLMNDLQNKINNRLQNALSVCSENFTSLTRLRIFLQDVNNKQWVNYQLRSQLRTVIIKVTVVSDKRAATSLSVMTSIIDYVKSILSLSLSQQDRLSSAILARFRVICSKIALRTRSTSWHLVHSPLIYMKSSFRRIKRMRKCLLLRRIARQKTRDFHQRRDERCVNFFNDEHVRWFFCFWIFDYWMCTF